MSPPLFLFLLLLFFRMLPSASSASSHCSLPPLRIGLLLPDAYRKRVDPWLELALQHLQQASSASTNSSSPSPFLRGHCLRLVPKDTACRPSLGLKALFDLMGHDEQQQEEEEKDQQEQGGQVVALFGDICTDVNEPVAMASRNWNIVHLSFTESHAKFGTAESNELYPTFFRLVPGERNLNRARCELIRAFGWRRVGSLKQSDHSSLSLSHERLTTRLEQDGVQVIYTASLSSEHGYTAIGAELEELKRRDLHIIVADLSEQLALRVMCAAFQYGLFGADFVWILPGFQTASGPSGSIRRQWWRMKPTEPETMNCSMAQLSRVLEGHFALEHVMVRPYSTEPLLVSGKNVRQVLREFRQLCAERSARHECRDELAHSAYAYDGVWTLGLALDKALAENWDHQHPVDKDRLLAAMRATNFQGLSGRVRFDDSGERLGMVQILQWSNGSYSALGYHDSAEDQFYLRKSARWTPPLDRTLVHRRREHVSATLAVAMCALALLGICVALAFFGVNVKYRDHRFIKMSSPNMNNLIICGSLCAYLSVFLLSIDTRLVNERTFERLCYAKTWILCTGFTLAFGAMFSKTWRVHSIFTNIRRDKKAIRDSKLYLIVATLLGVDGAVLLCWALVSPFQMSISEQGQFREGNRLIVPELERCESEHSLVFQVVFFLFKGMLMLFGCFLAWETRAVNVPALNDSKYIGMSVYIVVVMCVVGLALAFILQEHLNEAFAIVAFFVLCSTTLTLCLVFVPKVVELWRSPRGVDGRHGQRQFRKGMMKSVVGGSGGRSGQSRSGTQHSTSVGAGGSKHSVATSNTTATVPGQHTYGGGGGCSMQHAVQQLQEGLHRQLSLISAEELAKRSAQLEQDNLRLHQTLVTKSGELWDLLERVRLLTIQLKRGPKPDVELYKGKAKVPWNLLSVVQQNGTATDRTTVTDRGQVEGLPRRRSARLLSSVAHQLSFRMRRNRTSNRL